MPQTTSGACEAMNDAAAGEAIVAGGDARADGEASARLLIVDDNEINRRILAGILRKEACTLRTARDGAEAVALARAEPPDLILLDIMMPGKDGYEVCADLKTDPRTEHVPVIFLSALAETADKIRGLEMGAVDYITKPFDAGEVLARVRNQLKIQRLTDDLRRANRGLRAQQALIDADLRAAAVIQQSLVPVAPPPLPAIAVAWRFIPCQRIGGDLFNLVPLGPHHLAAYVIDVSGHGVPSAMVTVSLSQFLSPQAGRLYDGDAGVPAAPGEVLRRLDREYPIERFDKFCTVAYALLDLRDGRLRYAVAGHPCPLLQRRAGAIEVLDAGGPIIGLGAGLSFDDGETRLAAGDRLVLYSDGITEHAAADGALFGDERLRAVLAACRGAAPDRVCEHVLAALRAHGHPRGAPAGGDAPTALGVPHDDDITLLTLEYRGRQAA
ncbi:SpoIIE family protein phosphatase [bacterium]|nr:SpoIIE family protein phosphatase [bacterium]